MPNLHIMKVILTFLFLGLIGVTSFSQIEREREILNKLCSPEFDGRGYVNNGVNKAADYIALEFKNSGAQPISDDYFQELTMNVNTFPGKVQVAIGKNQLKPGSDFIIEATSGSFQGKIKLKNIDPIKLLSKDAKELDKLRALKQNEGALVNLTNYTNRDTLGMINQIYNALADITPTVAITEEKFMWSVGRNATNYPLIRVQDSAIGKKTKIEIHIENVFVTDFQTKNVIAKIKGKSADSCFVFTAHYDHLGRMGTDAYFPGANDNASGTTMLISLANYFSENQPEYDIYFIAFTGEEAGLVGSNYFVKHPTFDLQKIKFLLNLDIMGTGDKGITIVNGTIYTDQFNKMVEINTEKDLLPIVKARGKTQNSDHYFFQEEGVKTFFIYTMGENQAYHDIFDKAGGLDLDKFVQLRTLFIEFVQTYP